ncbi:NAD(P)H-dependent oxidoreductase [Paralcaligenes sp. KSB-10]|uniref:NADPH-dependent FMN reductase n=1 Tax=Paralcaligenes sp. KSB-10 TaxID=2901142 RepID=UPI001E37D350|nr:NAD(P)H-dependent oxidoreductase [Paralcaligenes sp. KSB-10]UHL64811.1 NAD(P)H-dependent oxidoreductase [Paralcaligenes sp. KSB-10]
MVLKLHVIICSTRPGRVGPSVAHWFNDYAAQHSEFEVVLVDLADFNLPLYDEPHHPALRQYEKEHTKAWSASVSAADAYVFVTPEYNYGPPPSFVNALNYVYKEWNYKPCGFVSYGGVSGGLRAVQLEKQLVTTLKMMPMVEGVAIPMVATLLDENKNFKANELIINSATTMLNELYRWTEALKSLRNKD